MVNFKVIICLKQSTYIKTNMMKASIVYMEKLDIKEEQTGKLNYHVNKCVIYFLFIGFHSIIGP